MFVKPLTVSSDRIYQILKSYNIPVRRICLELTESVTPTPEQSGEDEEYESAIRTLREVPFVVAENGIVHTKYCQTENREDNEQLKTYIQCGQVRTIQHILSCNKNAKRDLLDTKFNNGMIPIVYAAHIKKKEVVLLLSKEKPDISIASDDGTLLIDLIQDWDDIIQELMKVCRYVHFDQFFIQ